MPSGPYPIPTKPTRMKVTPEIAADWLENRNTQAQRRLSEYIAKKYAEIMAAGRWLLTHQGVAFDSDGFLIDGQHRLRAVVLSGVTVEMFVTPDCDAATFAVLDNGHKRRASQLVHARNAAVIAAAARILAVVSGAVTPDPHTQGGIYDGTMTTDLILEAVDSWPELPNLSAGVVQVYKYAKINQPVHLAVVAQASRSIYRDRLSQWFEGLTSGENLHGNDPRLLLRNRFLRDGRVLAHSRSQAYNLVAKAWNAHALNKPMGVLKVAEAEDVVRIVG